MTRNQYKSGDQVQVPIIGGWVRMAKPLIVSPLYFLCFTQVASTCFSLSTPAVPSFKSLRRLEETCGRCSAVYRIRLQARVGGATHGRGSFPPMRGPHLLVPRYTCTCTCIILRARAQEITANANNSPSLSFFYLISGCFMQFYCNCAHGSVTTKHRCIRWCII